MRKLILLVVLVGVVLVIRALPWYLSVGVVVGLVGVGWFAVPRLLRRMFVAPFKAKGRVLAGARATVHAVTLEPGSALPNPPVDETEEEGGPRRHVCIEVQVIPQPSEGPFNLWEPGELRLVPAAAKPENPDSDESSDDDAIAELGTVEVFEDGKWTVDEGLKYGGEQRLRLHFAVRPGVDDVKFRYYFEDFGSARLPA